MSSVFCFFVFDMTIVKFLYHFLNILASSQHFSYINCSRTLTFLKAGNSGDFTIAGVFTDSYIVF